MGKNDQLSAEKLLKKYEAELALAAQIAAREPELRAEVEALIQQGEIQDEQKLQYLITRKTMLDIVPVKIRQANERAAAVESQLLAAFERERSGVNQLIDGVAKRARESIAATLAPFCFTAEEAVNFAAKLPIVREYSFLPAFWDFRDAPLPQRVRRMIEVRTQFELLLKESDSAPAEAANPEVPIWRRGIDAVKSALDMVATNSMPVVSKSQIAEETAAPAAESAE